MELSETPVIGAVGPRSDGVDAAFWEGLADERLLIQRCPGCGRWIWPAAWSCPSCHRLDPAWEEVEPRGAVYTWTRTWQPFVPEFAEKVPYLTVVVELDAGGGTRLVGILLGDQETDPVIGEEVEGVVQPASELTSGVPVLRWRRPGKET